MSRIHAIFIALFVTAAVAVGAATAFTVANGTPDAGPALSESALQARAEAINAKQKALAEKLKKNPAPDRSPIVKVVKVQGGSSGGSTYNNSGSSSSSGSTTTRHDDDHGDDHDRGDDDGSEHDRGDDHGGEGHGDDD